MRKPWRIAALVVFVLSTLTAGLFGDRLLALSAQARDELRRYTELVSVAHERYGQRIAYQNLVFASIQGMLRTLDPHTNFLSPKAYADMREKQQSSFYGLGILVGMRNGQLTVITPIEGTPASRMGIRAGDIIGAIEGEPTETMSLDEAVQKLKGPKGTQVRITINRPGLATPLELAITRDEIPQNSVRYTYMIDASTGYIALNDFSRHTAQEMADAITHLKQQGMQRLLLDLRTNGGGLLDQAVDTVDQFVPKGSVIVETRGRIPDSFQRYTAEGKFPQLGMPVVVLVGSGTASAAEILSGAIQDHDMGLIVGTPTWGKGLVQTVYSLSYGAGLALTTAKYYTPSGRLIQRDYSSWYEYYNHDDSSGDETPPAAGPEARQVYNTDLGRKVYGGGGITPDVVVEPAEIAPFLQFLLARNAFFDFAVEYTRREKVRNRTWSPGPEALDRFGKWLEEKDLAKPDEVTSAFTEPKVRDFALRQIRAEVFNADFGLEARYQVLASGDNQIQTALGLFDRASQLLAERLELEGASARQARAAAR